MGVTLWSALFGGAVALALSAGGYLVAWGAMRATVSALALRVTALEREVSAVSEVKVSVARLQEGFDNFKEQFRDLNAAIRWMRDPAAIEALARGAPRIRDRP